MILTPYLFFQKEKHHKKDKKKEKKKKKDKDKERDKDESRKRKHKEISTALPPVLEPSIQPESVPTKQPSPLVTTTPPISATEPDEKTTNQATSNVIPVTDEKPPTPASKC